MECGGQYALKELALLRVTRRHWCQKSAAFRRYNLKVDMNIEARLPLSSTSSSLKRCIMEDKWGKSAQNDVRHG